MAAVQIKSESDGMWTHQFWLNVQVLEGAFLSLTYCCIIVVLHVVVTNLEKGTGY